MGLIVIGVAAFLSTFLGGIFALKYKNYLTQIMSITSGIILGVISFEIFPELIEYVSNGVINSNIIMVAFVCGFLLFHMVEKYILINSNHDEVYATHTHPHVGIFSVLMLIIHSFLDGLAIGIGFQINPLTGTLLAIAVLGHDFADGVNTISLMLKHKNTRQTALRFLFLDALAPVTGMLLSSFFIFSSFALALFLAYIGGSLLYICTIEIIPQIHKNDSSNKTVILTLLGVIFIYLLTYLAQIGVK